jgi:GNAT superfamily N-acetyltransferase
MPLQNFTSFRIVGAKPVRPLQNFTSFRIVGANLRVRPRFLHPMVGKIKLCPPYQTAIKIARLAVDRRLRGQGYGRQMVKWCISLVTDNSVFGFAQN